MRTTKLALFVATVTAFATLATAVPERADASGFYIPPHGARGLGRGGALVVGADDLNALWYNPALLAAIEGSEFMVDVTLVSFSTLFARAPRTLENGGVVEYEAVESSAPPIPVPQLAFATDFGLPDLVFGFGLYGPNGSAGKYPEDGPQRYSLINSEGSALAFINASVGWQATPWLRLGLGIQNLIAQQRFVQTTSGYPGFVGDPEDEDLDILLKTEVADAFSPSASAGVWVEATKGFELGLSLQLPFEVKDEDAEITTRLPTHPLFEDAEVEGSSVESGFFMPLIVRLGARVVGDGWDAEVDVVHERWSILDEVATNPNNVKVNNVPGIGTLPVKPLVLPANFKDTWSVRVGGDYTLFEGLDLRLGGLWEQAAVPDETVTVVLIDLDKVGVGAGGSWTISEGFILDFGYTHLFYLSKDVTTSIAKQQNPTNPDGALVVGNGRYEASSDLLGVGLRADW